MTLIKRKSVRRAASSLVVERSKIRALLKKGSRGNVYAFTQAVSHYSNFLSEYLFLAGVTDPEERSARIEKLLADCWRYLPYTKRVSDFERFLLVQLERLDFDCRLRLDEPHQTLENLSHEERFLLAARVFEGWSFKSLRLALRCSKRELSVDLMRLKCKLTGFKTHMLKARELFQVLRVSDLLEGQYDDKAARKVEQELASQYHAHQFKADWLSYRCELADLRLQMIGDEDENEALIGRVAALLKQQPMEQPSFSDSVINQFSFIRLPSR